ncbi:hypothetical protein [Streptomyces sp. NPDC006335]|uniref:hypothetical protein n=1 Tax=Streptomyces sp. NPDC006335 TaxID=3156895 RepID=UPI0033B9A6F8
MSDLQLAPPGRLDGPYGGMDHRRARMHADRGEASRGVLRLLPLAAPEAVADDPADRGDPRVGDGFRAAGQDILVGEGHRLSGRGVRDRARPGTGPVGQHESLHLRHLSPDAEEPAMAGG